MWPVGLIGFSSGWTMSCPGLSPGSAARFSASVLPVTVRQSPSSKSFFEQILHHGRRAADVVQIFLHVLAAGLEIGQIAARDR